MDEEQDAARAVGGDGSAGRRSCRHDPTIHARIAASISSCPFTTLRRTEPAAILGCAALTLLGLTGLLVPSLIRSIEPAFGQTDAGMGVLFFVSAVAYAGGSMGGGFLTERLGRRIGPPGRASP